MEAGRRKSQNDVAGANAAAIHDSVAANPADDATGKVIFIARIESRHLRCLAADECATHGPAGPGEPAHNLRHHLWVKLAGRQVVQEKQWRRAMDGNVVDAVIHDIHADRRMPAQHERNLELRSDAIHAGHKYGIARQSLKGKETSEGANVPEHTLTERLARELLDSGFGLRCRVDINAGISVAHRW